MADDPKYAMRLMRIRCSKGTMDNYINIERDHGVLAGGDSQPVLNANDHTDKCIIHCGNCESDENPERMFRKGLVGGLLGPLEWLSGGAVTDFLEDVGVMTCKCTPKTPLPWINTNENNILEGAPTLTMDSKVACRYGGVIEFVPLDQYPPEEPAAYSETSEEETTPAEDVVGDAFAAALDAAMSAVAETGAAGAAAVAKVQVALAAVAAMPAQDAQASHGCERDQGIVHSANDITMDQALSITDSQRAQNYGHNMAQVFPEDSLDADGMIINQGKLDMFNINNCGIDYGGCGAIALYNTIRTLNPDTNVTFPQTIYWMEPYGILNNTLGAVPMGITSVLNEMGYETQYCFNQDPAMVSAAAANADAAITLYATTEEVHYVAFHADPADGSTQEQTFIFYNESGSGGDSRTYEKFKDSLTSEYRTEIGSVTILVNSNE